MKNTAPKIFFLQNIKFLRERRKMTQESLATALGITRTRLAALEVGNTKAPQPEDYVNFSAFFKISVDTLLKVDLSKLGELKLRDLEAGNDVYVKGGNLRVLAISVDKSNKENVEYVPIKAKAGYAAGYNDPEFIATLPKYSLPHLPKDGTYRIFPISGDSMLPIPDGSDVVARYVADWSELKPGTPCIMILDAQQDFVFKLVTVNRDGTVLLTSTNTLYKPYTVQLAHILEIWMFHSFSSREMPEAATDIGIVLKEIRDLKASIVKQA